MFVLIHGAYKNVGDFLIYKNSKSLVEHCTGETDFLEPIRKAFRNNKYEVRL